MSVRCSSAACLNGDCQGCKKGVKYCNDPRCYPNCPDCEGETSGKCISKRSGWDWALLIIVGILSVILLVLIGISMWQWYNPIPETDSNSDPMPDNQQYYDQIYDPRVDVPAEQMMPEYNYDPVVDASLNVSNAPVLDEPTFNDVPQFNDIPQFNDVPQFNDPIPTFNDSIPTFNDVIPDIPPANLTGNVSVASGQTPNISLDIPTVQDPIIRGFGN